MARRTLPKNVEDYKAPWEVDAEGNDIPAEEQKLDPAKLKKLLHGLLSDKERALGTVEELRTAKEELESKVADAADPKALENLQAELQKAREDAEKAKSSGSVTALKLEIALEKGLTKRQVKYLTASTREELEEEADEILEDFGGKPKGRQSKDDKEGDDDDERIEPRRAPRGTRNPADPDPDADRGKKDPSPEEVMKQYMAQRA